jgi:mono/diheme cytochrome c family protein
MKRSATVVFSFVLGLLVIPVSVLLYFQFGYPPVAVADAPFPFEAKVVKIPLIARINREMPPKSPLAVNDANLIAGAQIYREQCSSCHGLKDKPSTFAAYTFPKTPQLWAAHKNKPGVVGVSDDPVEETYWKVRNGIRLSGMPSYQSLLTDQQMWQVSTLLSQAASPLPAAAIDSLTAQKP